MKMLSIVLPSYFEEENIGTIYSEILRFTGKEAELELIFVDDGSRDGTFERIRELAAGDPRVKGIRLSRNFGHQTALLAGLKEARGDRVVMMDVDGQHPPSLLPALIQKLEEGYDIVNTVRTGTKGAGPLKRVSSRWFYRVFNFLSDVRIEPASADFRIMNRQALDAFLAIGEHDRFTRGLVSWMGFSQATIPYRAERRRSGRSKYSFRKMRLFAVDGVTSFSSRPVRLSTLVGLITLLLGFAYMIYAVVMHLLGNTNPGWTSLMITILILGGIQLFTIGIIGEYISRIYRETKQRPHYFIQERTSGPIEKESEAGTDQDPVR